MNSIKKKMKLICKKIGVVMLAFCLTATGCVFLGAFGKNNKAVAEETTEQEWEILGDGNWATLQAKLFEGGYYKLDADFKDLSANDNGADGTRVDYKAVYNVDKYAFAETVPDQRLKYPFYSGCGPLLIIKDTTIDLNGFTIDRNRGEGNNIYHTYGMVFWIKEGATLKIIDSSIEKKGVIKGAKNKGSADTNNNPLKIDQKRVDNFFDDELKYYETNDGKINPNHECQVTYGGAFYVENGTLNLEGGSVQANADSYMNGKYGIGAGVYIGAGCSFKMSSDAIISDNTAYNNNNGLASALCAGENATIGISLNITIAGKHNVTAYDGKNHTVSKYSVESNLGKSISLSSWVALNTGKKASATQKNVGTATMGLEVGNYTIDLQKTEGVNIGSFTVTPHQIDGVNIESISVTVVDGYQTITPRNMTLKANDASSEYNGTEISYATATNAVSPYYTITNTSAEEGLAPNQSITAIDFSGSGTKVGTYVIDITEGSVKIGDNTSDYTSNYNITLEKGNLTIGQNSKQIEITSSSKNWPYDGQVHLDEAYTVTYDGVSCLANSTGKEFTLPTGDKVTITPTAVGVKDFDAAYNSNNTYTYTIDNSKQYGSVTAMTGTLSIDKCPITIKAEDKTKVYDNDLTTDPQLTSTVTGLPAGGVAPGYTLSREAGQDVGNYAISVILGENPNYDITVEKGTLTISPKEAVLAWDDTEFFADGKSHMPSATVSNLADGDTCEVTVEGAQTEVGDKYTATATALSNPNYKLPADATTTFKIKGYTIKFVDEDGAELQSGTLAYGAKPSYTGKTPVKAADSQYSYEFLDWSPAITEVTGDKTYKATYKSTQKKYTVEAGSLPEGVTLSFSGKETVEAGKGVTFTVVLGKGYDKGDDFAVAVNGTKLEPNADGSYTTQGIVKDSVISVSGVSKVEYSITKGEGTKYTLGSADGSVIFTFKRSVNDKSTFGRFTRAEMDGREIDPKNYNKSSGSLILELKKEYLETLSAGEHLIKVYFDDDADGAVAHLIIVAASVTPAPASDSSPTTGDTSAPILWIILLAAALVGISEMVYLKSRSVRE